MFGEILIIALIITLVLIIMSIFIKILRRIIKLLFAFGSLLIIFLLIGSFLVLKDFQDLSRHSNDTMLYLLECQGKFVAGFSSSAEQGDFILMKQPELSRINENISRREYSSVLNGYYKIYMFSIEAIEPNIEEGSFFYGQNLSKEFVISILKSDDASEFYTKRMIEEGKIPESEKKDLKKKIEMDFGDSAGLKSVFFASTLTNIMRKNSLFIILESSAGGVRVYPETALFKMLKVIPILWTKEILNKSIKSIKSEDFGMKNLSLKYGGKLQNAQ